MIVDDHHFKIGKFWRFNLKPQQKGDQKKNSFIFEIWSMVIVPFYL